MVVVVVLAAVGFGVVSGLAVVVVVLLAGADVVASGLAVAGAVDVVAVAAMTLLGGVAEGAGSGGCGGELGSLQPPRAPCASSRNWSCGKKQTFHPGTHKKPPHNTPALKEKDRPKHFRLLPHVGAGLVLVQVLVGHLVSLRDSAA